MSQPITVSVTMDAASFRRFRWFDLLQHNRIWKRPLVFTAILLVFAGVCLTQLNTRHEAGLLAGVLALVALGLPAVYFWNCAHGIKIFIRKLGLDQAAKPFYRLQLDETGLSIWMAGEQDKAAPSRQLRLAPHPPGLPDRECHLPLRPSDAGLLMERQPRRRVGSPESSSSRRPPARPALTFSQKHQKARSKMFRAFFALCFNNGKTKRQAATVERRRKRCCLSVW